MPDISFSTNIRVVDRLKLFEAAAQMGLLTAPTIGRVAATVVLNPAKAPSQTGFKYLPGTDGHRTGEDDFCVDAVLRVYDPDAFIQEACERYQACHNDAGWRPATLAEAAYQVVVASNANILPSDCGYEVVDVEYGHDAVIVFNSGPKI